MVIAQKKKKKQKEKENPFLLIDCIFNLKQEISDMACEIAAMSSVWSASLTLLVLTGMEGRNRDKCDCLRIKLVKF